MYAKIFFAFCNCNLCILKVCVSGKLKGEKNSLLMQFNKIFAYVCLNLAPMAVLYFMNDLC